MKLDLAPSSPTRDAMTSTRIGRRVQAETHRGIVRFDGVVAGTKGLWLGVDWDDAARGKHDGSHEGVSYFVASSSTSASFVRETKVDFGKPFCQAVRERYTTRLSPEVADSMYVKGDGNQITSVKLVGNEAIANRQSQTDKLKEIHVADMRVAGLRAPGDEDVEGEDSASYPRLATTLGLQANLISSWDDVASIVRPMTFLSSLLLDDNRLAPPEDAGRFGDAFRSLVVISLNRMNLDWSTLSACFPMWPSLEELIAADNSITSTSSSSPLPPRLRLLNLDGNALLHWRHVFRLAPQLQGLQTLSVAGCRLGDLEDADLGEEASFSPLFPALNRLSAQNNVVARWTTLSFLAVAAPRVEDLVFARNPVLQTENFETNRQLILMKFPRLRRLDHIEIDAVERRGAEIDYYKRFAADFLRASDAEARGTFRREHPAYDGLVSLFGAPELQMVAAEAKVSAPKTLKAALVEVELGVEGAAATKGGATRVKKKIPASMSVKKAKAMAARMFGGGVDPRGYEVKIVSDDRSFFVDNEFKEIGYYEVVDGDLLLLSKLS